MAEKKITTEQKVHFRLNPQTNAGNPSEIDGKATFTLPEGAKATLEEDEDGLGATVISGNEPEELVLSVSADAKLGEEVETISTTILFHIVAPQANGFGVSFDEAVNK